MNTFVAQVFFSSGKVRRFFVEAETWQEAQKSAQAQYPGLPVSVHSLEAYREAAKKEATFPGFVVPKD